ncbi:Formiminoglutamic iminohydrolase [hydrothermal vent metagenome]|uniref:Formiminoglutamic iminohydrolase n=1 Tax=hydrothermal vent metagenome TaxID=652676 RepID=A0A3B0SFU0_9ZZZZ
MMAKPTGKTTPGCLLAKQAMLGAGWAQNVLLEWDNAGKLTRITPNHQAKNGQQSVDILLPGMANLHCHSFQRAMSGLAETAQSDSDSFWSWRELMYRFVQHLGPDDIEAIAAFAYMEMLESGFTSVGEFHYLHHQPDGTPYDNPAELANRIMAGARATDIALTLLPVFYAHSDFGGAAPTPAQARFVHTLDSYHNLLQHCRQNNPDVVIGIAPHSLRAVTPGQLTHLLAANPDGPVHIHVAEQIAEVIASQKHLGARPVHWLLQNFAVDQRWCLVHATHMDKQEIRGFAGSGAVAGLCPLTEANLGDGIFDGVGFLAAGGKIGIGSDSCVRIDVAEELRWLEYTQRLRDQKRLRLAPAGRSVGAALYRQTARSGAVALGQAAGDIMLGTAASFVTLNANHPALLGRKHDALLDGWVFGSGASVVEQVWVKGKQVVADGKHIQHDLISNQYQQTLRSVLPRIEA